MERNGHPLRTCQVLDDVLGIGLLPTSSTRYPRRGLFRPWRRKRPRKQARPIAGWNMEAGPQSSMQIAAIGFSGPRSFDGKHQILKPLTVTVRPRPGVPADIGHAAAACGRELGAMLN
jgi:hypothetical protein